MINNKRKSLRLISRLEIKSTNVVKGINMEGLRVVGNPEIIAKQYFLDGIDEIILSDVVASLYGRNHLFELVEKISKDIFIPIVVGGGIRSLKDIEKLLKSGADKVVINTAAVRNPELITEAAAKYGSQCIIIEIHAKFKSKNCWEVYVENGREKTNLDLVKWMAQVEKLGAGEILIVSVDRDGTFRGLDENLLQSINNKISIPLIIAGGANSSQNIIDVVNNFDIDAVSISHALHFNKIKIKDLKDNLLSSDIETRLLS
tara:strand:- start:563 stop:1342 length:780 start_codon:yes stop_codon:yes gene_type:complete